MYNRNVENFLQRMLQSPKLISVLTSLMTTRFMP